MNLVSSFRRQRTTVGDHFVVHCYRKARAREVFTHIQGMPHLILQVKLDMLSKTAGHAR
jgi:hypothetical protein